MQYSDYEDLLFEYNWTGDGKTGYTKILPTTGITAGSGGGYTINYTFLSTQSDIIATGNYSTSDDEYTLYEPLKAKQIEAVEVVLHQASYDYSYTAFFSDVANIDFSYGTTSNSQITFGNNDMASVPSRAGYQYTWDLNAPYSEDLYGDVWFNDNYDPDRDGVLDGWDDLSLDSYAMTATMHEIGHALGLKGDGDIAGSPIDNHQYTIMSYNALAGMDADPSAYGDTVFSSGLQIMDIAALQAIYGANTSTRSGNTTYKEGQGFAASVNDAFIYTIWDGAGTDTIDASGYADGVTIDLREGHFSSIGKAADSSFQSDRDGNGINETWELGLAKNNVAIAYDAEIEHVIGTAQADKLVGNDLANTLDGGAGNDTLEGGAGQDTYVYNSGDGHDTVADDWTETNSISFGSAISVSSLTFSEQFGDLKIDVDASNSITLLNYAASSESEVALFQGSNAFGTVLFGTSANEGLTGDTLDNVIYGLGGNDSLSGYGGSDRLYGGDGNDTIYDYFDGNGQTSWIDGGAGEDYISAQNGYPNFDGTFYIDGGADNDEIAAGNISLGQTYISDSDGDEEYIIQGYNVWIDDTDGDDTYKTSAVHDVSIRDTDGFDTIEITFMNAGSLITSISGDDLILSGSLGYSVTIEDYFLGSEYQIDEVKLKNVEAVDLSLIVQSSNSLFGSNGVNAISGTASDDTIFGFAGTDTLLGASGADVLAGGSGNDTLDGGDGDDTLNGGDGIDTASYANDTDRVLIDLTNNLARQEWNGSTGTTLDTLSSIENAAGGAYSDRIIGSAANNVIHGNAGNDVIYGYDGDDTIYGGDGDDEIYGDHATATAGDGADVVYGEAGDDTIIGSGGDDDLYGGDGNDLIHGGGGEDEIWGGDGSDTIYGNDDDDIIHGGAGSDTMYGNGGFDTIYGDAGNDFINGQAVQDTIYGGDDNDTIWGYEDDDVLEGGNGSDIIYGDDQFNTVGFTGAGNDTIRGNAGNDSLYGGDGTDTIYGGTEDDNLFGNAGNDNLYGDEGNDILTGDFSGGDSVNDGDDTLYGGAGADTLFGRGGDDELHGGDGNDTVYGHGGADTLYGDAGNDTIAGFDGADILNGGTGVDGLFGNDGDDVLSGGDGSDTLTGGADADTFTFLSGESGTDTVTDFSTGDGDKLDISDVIDFDPLADTITDFVQITDNGTHSTLAVDADGTANGTNFVTVATLSNVTGLTDEAALVTSGNLIAA